MVDRGGGPWFSEEQRLAFGRAADLYDEIRPGYPADALDALMVAASLGEGDRVYEVGAGTGKGTVALAARGLDVLALEPSPEMARLARRNCAAVGRVQLIECDFEQWTPRESRKALVSFQAWHWTQPAVRYKLAHDALVAGGTLAAVWTFPHWSSCELATLLRDAYMRAAPLMPASFPMHPSSDLAALGGDWHRETRAEERFERPMIQEFQWNARYTAEDYTRLLQTHQDHMLLDTAVRQYLMFAIRDVIERGGGTFELPLITYVCTATRV